MASEFCSFVKADGAPCRAQRLTGSAFCFAHGPDPGPGAKIDSARRAGVSSTPTAGAAASLGISRHQKGLLNLDSTRGVPLTRFSDIVQMIEKTIHQVRRGEIDASVGRTVIDLCNLQVKILLLASKATRDVSTRRGEFILPRRSSVESPEANAASTQGALKAAREERNGQAGLAEQELAGSVGKGIDVVETKAATVQRAADDEASRHKQGLAEPKAVGAVPSKLAVSAETPRTSAGKTSEETRQNRQRLATELLQLSDAQLARVGLTRSLAERYAKKLRGQETAPPSVLPVARTWRSDPWDF